MATNSPRSRKAKTEDAPIAESTPIVVNNSTCSGECCKPKETQCCQDSSSDPHSHHMGFLSLLIVAVASLFIGMVIGVNGSGAHDGWDQRDMMYNQGYANNYGYNGYGYGYMAPGQMMNDGSTAVAPGFPNNMMGTR